MKTKSALAAARGFQGILSVIAGIGLLLVAGCATTQKAELKPGNLKCAFLGSDCSKLSPGPEEGAALRYNYPKAEWTRYNKVLVSPVTFWGGDTTPVPTLDQQELVNYFNEKLREKIGEKMQLADRPGPGVLKLEVAMTDAETATPMLRSISMIVPQAHMLSNLKYLATGTFPFVGGAQAEAKVTDSVTGQTLALAVDRRIGGGSFTSGFQWQWGDAQNAIDAWCERAANKLSAWTSGTEKPQP
ncbi:MULTISPECIES: DUF3313 domain-containing protein [Methylococcus]|uniref:DUF3313 domain-containing protein n=1 Tax=Methylococcus capsulatus TaxID=414 RepID=A0ABZ2F7N7_METCP|nr:DUF3313 domain-containing protein [Methylococcus capsulatus]